MAKVQYWLPLLLFVLPVAAENSFEDDELIEELEVLEDMELLEAMGDEGQDLEELAVPENPNIEGEAAEKRPRGILPYGDFPGTQEKESQ